MSMAASHAELLHHGLLLTPTEVDEGMLCTHTNICLPSCAPYEIWDVLWLHGISHRVNKLTQWAFILNNMASNQSAYLT